MVLHNKIGKKVLRKRLMEETFRRITLSFYRYVIIANPNGTRDDLYKMWNALNVFGRIYVAREGINAQLSVPENHFAEFQEKLYADERFCHVPFKIAVEGNGKSFYKLIVKVRSKIVADGLCDGSFDVTNVGKHLTAKEFNDDMENPETIVVDMRNHYESEVGHFKNAVLPQADTFKEELPMVAEQLSRSKSKKILLYCTGGIRCEKASAYLKHHGFKDVNQLYGGIIEYARQVKQNNLTSKFIGKNFVFDERLGERITDDIVALCHQCEERCDTHTNCKNDDCHLLFIQCEACAERMNGCCSEKCKEISSLPEEEQRKFRKGKQYVNGNAVYKSRLRPKLSEGVLKIHKHVVAE